MEMVPGKACRMLSNYEVHALLKSYSDEMKVGKHKTGSRDQNLFTLTHEILRHLECTPCITQDEKCIANVCLALQPYSLTKAELLQIINLRPRTPVEISLVIEESEERISESQIDEILEIINRLPPGPGSEDNSVEGEEAQKEEAE